MKVLITSNYHLDNLYIYYLYLGIQSGAEVICSSEAFWISDLSFDIIHIQWPENLRNHIKIQDNYLTEIEERLNYWKAKGAKLVITRHNYKPHNSNSYTDEIYKKIYDACYSSVDAIVHHGNTSIIEFLNHDPYRYKLNVFINHPNYLIDIPNDVTRLEARNMLGIGDDEFIFFSFGHIRSKKEEKMIIDGYNQVDIKKKGLIISNSFLQQQTILKWKFLNRLLCRNRDKRYNWKNIHMVEQTIINPHIQVYMNASDIVITPRIKTLNSGVVFMGFSFSKIVIGPDSGNVGEILKITGNPFFNPNDIASIADAMKEAYLLSKTDLGDQNLEYVKKECDIYILGEKYLGLYKRLLSN